MSRLSFSLKRLIISFTLIAAGLAINVWFFRLDVGPRDLTILEKSLLLVIFFASGPMIGAGILCPFKQTIIGAALGILLSCFAFVSIIFMGF